MVMTLMVMVVVNGRVAWYSLPPLGNAEILNEEVGEGG